MKFAWLILALLIPLAVSAAEEWRTRHFLAPEESFRAVPPPGGSPFQPKSADPLAGFATAQEWNDLLEPHRLEAGLPWYDARAVLKHKGIEIPENGSALWNRSNGELLVRADRKQLAGIETLLAQIEIRDRPHFGPRTTLEFEAHCVACTDGGADAQRALLEDTPTLKRLLAGDYGKPRSVANLMTRGISGVQLEAAAQGTPEVKEFKVKLEGIIAPDGYTIAVNALLNLHLTNGAQFSQSTSFDLAEMAPALLELGGAGTEKDPAYFLILRGAVTR